MKKFLSIVLLLAMTIALLFGDSYGVLKQGESEEEKFYKNALIIWYTDPDLGEYIRDAAVTYENKTGVKVIPTEVSEVEYLEQIQKSTTEGNKAPDLFVLSDESLEKAVLSGLAGECADPDHVLNSGVYTDASLRAVTYRDSFYGYPLSYETAFLIYNETAMEEIAGDVIRREEQADEIPEDTEGITLAEGVTAEGEGEAEEEELTEEDIAKRRAKAQEILPTSVVGILDFANQYNLPSDVEGYFLWDTEDVLYSYWFAGAYLNVGGKCSDRNEDISIYNENALYSLSVFRDFKDFFSMEDKVTYEDSVSAFMNRKCLFTVAGTDIVGKLANASGAGDFTDEYGVLPMTMLNANLSSKGLGVTNMICVNGLKENRGEAERFADFATSGYISNLYARCGKMSAAHLEEYAYPQMEDIEKCYDNSVSLPKMVETTNYYILVEMCFANIWDGRDVNDELKSLSESVLRNYYGNDFVNETIETPEIVENYNAQDEN